MSERNLLVAAVAKKLTGGGPKRAFNTQAREQLEEGLRVINAALKNVVMPDKNDQKYWRRAKFELVDNPSPKKPLTHIGIIFNREMDKYKERTGYIFQTETGFTVCNGNGVHPIECEDARAMVEEVGEIVAKKIEGCKYRGNLAAALKL